MVIKSRIYLMFLLFILVGGVITLMIARTFSVSIIKDEISRRLVSTTQSRAHHVRTVLREREEITKTLASGNPFRDAVDPEKDYTRRLKQVNRRIESVIQSYEEISRIRVLDTDGIVIASSHADVGFDESSHEIFQKAKDSLYIRDVHISRFTGNEVMSYSAPILVKGKFSGVVVINFNVKELFEIMADRTGLGKTGEIYIINKSGYVITPSRFIDDAVLKYKVNTENVEHCFEDIGQFGKHEHEHKAMLFKNYLGRDVLGVHAHIPEMGWCLLAEISKEEAFAPVNKLTHSILLTIVVLLVVGAIFSSFVSKKITQPIVKLHHGTEEIERGNLDYKVGTKEKDEIGQLSRSFDNMAAKLKKSMEELKTRNISLEEKVRERTIQLEQRVKEIERQKTEIASIAQEFEKANKDLKTEIAERKLVEKALRESEERYKALFDCSAEGILVADIDSKKFKYANPAICRMLGYTEEALKQLGVSDIYPQESLEHVISEFEAQAKGEKTLAVNIPCLRKDGTLIYANISTTKVIINGRECNVGFFTDITKQKQAEEKLRESEIRFQTIINASKDAIITIGEDGRISIFNPAAENLFGWSEKEMLGQPLDRIMPEEYRQHHDEYVRGYFTSGEPHGAMGKTVELPAVKRDGTQFPIELSLSDGHFADKQFVMAVIRDITSRKRSEKALRESEEKFRRVIETSPVAIWSQSSDQTKTYFMSPAIENITGYAPDEFIENPKMLHDIIQPDDKEKYIQHLTKLLDNLEAQAFELQVVNKNYSVRVISVFLSPGYDDRGDIVRIDGVAMDITDKKVLENQIAQSEKMAAIGVLAAGVAHEFNNLLGGIMGNLSFAQNFPNNIETCMKSINESMKATEQASELIQSLLSYSRREDEIGTEVRVLEILDDIIRLVGEELKIKGIKLDREFQKVPEIKGSPSQLQQVFLNILINAIHAVGEDGVISIKAWSDGKKVFIKFSDNGVGIEEENINKIFDPFYSTKGVWGDNTDKGTGLGLSVSYNIIKAHHGDIMVESKPGIGTKVTVVIPIGTAGKSEGEGPKFVNEFNALVVEFDQKQAEILTDIIRKLGGRPVLCNWCDEAIKKANQLDFDYTILDANHPAMAGLIRFIDFIKSKKPSLPVILTSRGPIKYQYREYAKMASGIISKPFTFDKVADVLMKLQQYHKETSTDKV